MDVWCLDKNYHRLKAYL